MRWIGGITEFPGSYVFECWSFLQVHFHSLGSYKEESTWIPGGGTYTLGGLSEFSGDEVTLVAGVFLALVAGLVLVFSSGYLGSDPHGRSFLATLSLFSFFMSLLIHSGDAISFLIGWEGVGVLSYLLISFWSTRHRAVTAGVSAILFNLPGDAALMVAFLLVSFSIGDWSLSNPNLSVLWLKDTGAAWLFLLASACKSAQVGMHPWLPEAMEGPTPVSALLHAATLVTAGAILWVKVPLPTNIMGASVAGWGLATAFLAASAGCEQSDIKSAIAFSTCSQIGLAISACGLGLASPALFHLTTHAFFKADLFMAAGWLITSSDGAQQLSEISSKSSGLLPLFLASASLAGAPFFAGGVSKGTVITSVATGGFWMTLGTGALITASFNRLLQSIGNS